MNCPRFLALLALAIFCHSAQAQEPATATPPVVATPPATATQAAAITSPTAITPPAPPASSTSPSSNPLITPRNAPLASPLNTESGGLLQLSIYLILLLALLSGGFYVMRNGWGIFQAKPKGERKLQIIENRMLGNRQFLIVAEYENRKVLLGVCPGQINYLCTLSESDSEFSSISTEKSDA